MSRLESNQSQPVRLIVYGWQHYAALLKFLAVKVLKANLNEFDCVFCFDLAQVEDNQVKHLLHLHCVFLVFVFFECYLVNNRRET